MKVNYSEVKNVKKGSCNKSIIVRPGKEEEAKNHPNFVKIGEDGNYYFGDNSVKDATISEMVDYLNKDNKTPYSPEYFLSYGIETLFENRKRTSLANSLVDLEKVKEVKISKGLIDKFKSNFKLVKKYNPTVNNQGIVKLLYDEMLADGLDVTEEFVTRLATEAKCL